MLKMPAITDTYTTKDGETIFYYKWKAKEDIPYKGVVQIAHGVGEHAGRYKSIAKVLRKSGYDVYANGKITASVPGSGITTVTV